MGALALDLLGSAGMVKSDHFRECRLQFPPRLGMLVAYPRRVNLPEVGNSPNG